MKYVFLAVLAASFGWALLLSAQEVVPAAKSSTEPSSSSRGPRGKNFNPDSSNVLDFETMKSKGTWYEARVPGTLDLAVRAELAIHALIGDVDPEHFYGVYQGFKFNADPPAIEGGHTGKTQDDALYGLALTPRNVRTLPMLRLMSGSDYGFRSSMK